MGLWLLVVVQHEVDIAIGHRCGDLVTMKISQKVMEEYNGMVLINLIAMKKGYVFPGSSSSSMGPEVIDIDDVPVSGDQMPKMVSRSKRKGKQKEV
ncbi:hypothetical protein Tco_0970694 [Tanacetum coccineum]